MKIKNEGGLKVFYVKYGVKTSRIDFVYLDSNPKEMCLWKNTLV